MGWISVNKDMPALARKALAWSASKGEVIVRLVRGSNGDVFIDANAMPVRDVIFWQYVVAPNETDVL